MNKYAGKIFTDKFDWIIPLLVLFFALLLAFLSYLVIYGKYILFILIVMVVVVVAIILIKKILPEESA